MSEEVKKKNKIIGISIGILVVLLVVISSTYAYWQITKSQDDPNKIIAACLNFDVDFPVGITEENKWPMDSSEAMSSLDGYTFTVTNNCEEDVTYVIGLESVTSDNITNYLSAASIGVGFDGVSKGTYASLTDLEGPTSDARESKKLQTAVVKGKSEVEGENVNTHNLKIWIDSSSDVSEQSKGFSAKLFITGGPQIKNDMPNELTADTCFEMSGGEIIGYDESCGTSVTIPSEVDGVAVTTIDTDAFKEYYNVETVYYDESITYSSPQEVESVDLSSATVVLVKSSYERGSAVDFANIVSELAYAISLTDDADINAALQSMGDAYGLEVYTEETAPELEPGQLAIYGNLDASLQGEYLGGIFIDAEKLIAIEGLDLSQAINLEFIEPLAFTNYEATGSNKPSFQEQQESKPLSLTSLTFGKTLNELTIGYGAFNGIDVDNLTLYSNMVPITDGSYSEYGVVGPFAGAKINKLNIEYSEGYSVIGTGALYQLLSATEVIVAEGIKELGTGAFYGDIDYNMYVEKITLPNTIEKVGNSSLTDVKNVVFSKGSCENMSISRSAWGSTTTVTPSTCVVGEEYF